jgi:hypothetical protein
MQHTPAFTVGISGHMAIDPNDVDTVGDTIRAIFDWLMQSDTEGGINGLETLGAPLGLSPTSIVLLSSLAPGVDQIAVNVACKRRIRVQAPLPFPHPMYRNASTFKRGNETDAERQATYDAIVEKVGVDSLFFVERPGDLDLDPQALEEVLQKDLNDRVERNYRYRAAGEFIAVNCDLLIAVCDRLSPEDHLEIDPGLPIDAQPGAAFVVDARLYGASPAMLPMQSSLTWSDNGPVVRVFVRNDKKESSEDCLPTGHVVVWHPLDSRPLSATDQEWHEQEMRSLRSFAGRIKDLNQRFAAMQDVNADKECAVLLPDKSTSTYRPQTLLQRWWSPAPKSPSPAPYAATEKLTTLAALRRKAARVNRDADGRIKFLIDSFLVIAAVIVLLLQFCEYWIPARIETLNQTESIASVRVMVFSLAVLLTAFSWVLVLKARRERQDERQNDYRAIAEALRVQFFWTAGGTGESVDQRYLQRQKNELSWIRAAVSSAATPISCDRTEFASLSDQEQLDRLHRIQQGWIGEQLTYFRQQTFKLGQRKHWLHFFANIFLVAGVLMIFVGIAAHLLSLEHGIAGLAQQWGGAALPQILVAMFLGFLVNELIAAKAWKQSASQPGKTMNAGLGIHQPPTRSHWTSLHHYSERISSSPWTVIAAGILLGTASVSTIFGCSWNPDYFPAAIRLNSLSKNLLLAAAGLLHSRAAFNFLSQNVRRYSTMIGLFRGANDRMERLLRTLQDQCSPETPEEERKKTIKAIQMLLVDLGIEALNENSEWLQMHRTTPVAPLMPVG